MATERNTGSFPAFSGENGEKGEKVFNADPETLRAENTRLQRDLTLALEERNRLLKNRGAPSSAAKGGTRILEGRLENARRELDEAKQEQKRLEERIRALEEHLTATGSIPGVFIAKLEEAVISSGGHSDNAGTPMENAADEPQRVSERFDAAVDNLWAVVKDSQIMHNHELRQENQELLESLEYSRNEANKLREEREVLNDKFEDLQGDLLHSEGEVTVRDSKLSDLERQLEEREAETKKQADTILRLKQQLGNLRGSVDAELYSHVTGSGGKTQDSEHTWRDHFRTRASLFSVFLGVASAAGAWWLIKNLEPTIVAVPTESAYAPVETTVIPGEPEVAQGEKIPPPPPVKPSKPFSGETRRDGLRLGGHAPLMVKLPGDSFTMGTNRYDAQPTEKPARPAQVDDFYISRFEVSFNQYDAFARSTGLKPPNDQGWGRGNRPVINITWDEARAYTDWLSKQTGHRYRLPTDAEWEYAMGTGHGTIYWWGNDFQEGQEICFNCGSQWDGVSTAPVGEAKPNPFSLYDMGGNVMEWVEDCLTINNSGNCNTRVIRGGAFNRPNETIRTTSRRGMESDSRHSTVGFRVVREIN